jgi:hypothetical protein
VNACPERGGIKTGKMISPDLLMVLESIQDPGRFSDLVAANIGLQVDDAQKLLEILDSIEDPYTCSLVCLLLGLMGPRDGIQHIWNYYHFFKDEYGHKTYDQGPLLALYEMKDRFGLKS